MPLDPYIASKLSLMENIDFHAMTDDMVTRMTEFYQDPEPWLPGDDVRVADTTVQGPHGLVPCRVYRPESSASTALVWAHGGGFATGDLDMLEAHMVSAELCRRAGIVVVSVDYRLAQNGVRYPIPVDDVHAVVTAALDGEFDVSAELTRVSVGGASAGAALALAAALRTVGSGRRLDALLLAYPLAHFPSPGLDPDVDEELNVLPRSLRTPASNVEWMVRNYVGRISAVPVDAIPGDGQLAGLPPTRIVVSEYDDLRASAELLYRQLQDAAVEVETYTAVGMPHGHLNRSASLPEVARSLDFFAEAFDA